MYIIHPHWMHIFIQRSVSMSLHYFFCLPHRTVDLFICFQTSVLPWWCCHGVLNILYNTTALPSRLVLYLISLFFILFVLDPLTVCLFPCEQRAKFLVGLHVFLRQNGEIRLNTLVCCGEVMQICSINANTCTFPVSAHWFSYCMEMEGI